MNDWAWFGVAWVTYFFGYAVGKGRALKEFENELRLRLDHLGARLGILERLASRPAPQVVSAPREDPDPLRH